MENALSERVIGAIFEVSNILGAGFLEKVYERALAQELRGLGLRVEQQFSFPVIYKGHCVGDYFADLVIENTLVVELKCAERLTNEHFAQCLNYLKASGKELCLLVNFQRPRVEIRRVASRNVSLSMPATMKA